ncbi:MAG TPA: phosphatase PAP2 family protein [Caldilineaceae bacterium]|nr:phosphatase PAP2 family protein [Caldilineaceae bacterium]
MTMQEIWQWGINLILLLQSNASWLDAMRWVTFTGSTEFFLFVLPALYWLVDRRLAARLATLLLLSIALGSILKIAAHGPRPYWIDARIQLLGGEEPTFGLPSLHAMNAMVMWPLLAHYLNRLWAWVVALFLIVVAGTARVYLGVHFPSDVIVGWLLGLLLLVLWMLWAQPIGDWFVGRTAAQQRIMALYLSIGVVLLGAVVRLLTLIFWNPTAGWVGRWPQHADRFFQAFSLGDVVTAAAVFAGMVSGLHFCRRYGHFVMAGRVLQLMGRYLIGVVGVLILWQGLDIAFALVATDDTAFGYALRYLRYGLIGFWIFGLAPLVFVTMRLAQREDSGD